ncbi:MAG: hypothetical protein LC751_06495 [Actinobacteria bacterium]|nr:hypothetical protein [Actinomycetota bacterium]MCA1737437.1 hypothetical protein [Actinomycetota bacterium]
MIVNANESEPGYWADKVMHKEYLDEFLKVYKALKTIFGFEQVTMCIHEKDREWYAYYDGHDDGVHDVRCVPDKYALGEEKALINRSPTRKCPGRWSRPTLRAPGDAARCRHHRQQLGDPVQRLQRALFGQARHHGDPQRLR